MRLALSRQLFTDHDAKATEGNEGNNGRRSGGKAGFALSKPVISQCPPPFTTARWNSPLPGGMDTVAWMGLVGTPDRARDANFTGPQRKHVATDSRLSQPERS